MIVAMSKYQKPFVPGFAGMLDPDIVQLHSLDYRNPAQLRDGSVLLVGAANSASEIARDLAPARKVFALRPPSRTRSVAHRELRGAELRHSLSLPGRLPPHPHRQHADGAEIPARILKVGGAPLIRVKPKDLDAHRRRARAAGRRREGWPAASRRRPDLDVANVVWCTGFSPGLEWIDLPIFDADGHVVHHRGVTGVPGLYVLGLGFLYAYSSMMIQGVGRDAAFIAGANRGACGCAVAAEALTAPPGAS